MAATIVVVAGLAAGCSSGATASPAASRRAGPECRRKLGSSGLRVRCNAGCICGRLGPSRDACRIRQCHGWRPPDHQERDGRLQGHPHRGGQRDDGLHVHEGHPEQRQECVHRRVPRDMAGVDRSNRLEAIGREWRWRQARDDHPVRMTARCR